MRPSGRRPDMEKDEERRIKEEHENWKLTKTFWYDKVITHALEWPSLTVQWLPGREEVPDKDYTVQKLILGTHASDNGPNYLMLAQIQLPFPSPLEDDKKDGDELGEIISFDELAASRGGAGGAGGASSQVQIIHKINHEGGVNRARYMPQNPAIIATKTINAEVHVFDYNKHQSKPPLDGAWNPDLRLKGHFTEGYGLSWSIFKQGYLLSGSNDAQICLWDIYRAPKNTALDALRIFKVNDSIVEDVAWHLGNEYLFGSVGDDHCLHIWDLKTSAANKPIQSVDAHNSEVNCLAFDPFNEWVVATGSSDKTVKLFDLRKINISLHTSGPHKGGVFQVGWSPRKKSILAYCCLGRRLMVWDLSSIGQEEKNGQPEMLFIHNGHTGDIHDFSWNPWDDRVIASVAQDNILQIWKMPRREDVNLVRFVATHSALPLV